MEVLVLFLEYKYKDVRPGAAQGRLKAHVDGGLAMQMAEPQMRDLAFWSIHFAG